MLSKIPSKILKDPDNDHSMIPIKILKDPGNIFKAT